MSKNGTKRIWISVLLTLILAGLATAGLGYMSLGARFFPFVTRVIFTAAFIYYAKDTKYFKFLLFFLLFVTFIWIFSGTGLRYGRLNSMVIAALVSTDRLEVIEYLQLIPACYPLLAILFALLSWTLLRHFSASPLNITFKKTILLLILFSLSSFGAFAKRAIEESRSYVYEERALELSLKQEASWQIESVTPFYEVYVVVIGESVTKDYMSLYGYHLQTTPFLDKAPITYVTNYVAPAPNTYTSFSRVFSRSIEYAPDPLHNVVTLANQAGYKTYWYSNQGYLGEVDTYVSSIAAKSHKPFFLKKGSYNSINIDDDELFPHIRTGLNEDSDQPKVIFIHSMGSHPNTCERLFDFPNKFNEGKGKSFDCYLASIEKTDAFLKTLYEMLDQHKKSYSMLYLSDHGLTIELNGKMTPGKAEIDIHHGNRYQQNYSVPLLWISSNNLERREIDKTISGFDFIHLYANWLGIREASLNSEITLESFKSNLDPIVFDGEKNRSYKKLPRLPTY